MVKSLYYTTRWLVMLSGGLYLAGLATYLVLRLVFGDRFWWLAAVNNVPHFLFIPLMAVFPMLLLIRARKLALVALVMVTVGMAWFVPYFIPKVQAAANGPTLRVLSFNVWGNNHRLEGVEAWIREQNADLVFLQEVSPAYARDSMPGLAEVYPYQLGQRDGIRWGGNVVLSRYPLVDVPVVNWREGNENGFQRVTVEVNGQQVALYNTHLAFPVGGSRIGRLENTFYLRVLLGYQDDARNAQRDMLVDMLETEPLPFIVAGDFNTSDLSPSYSALASVMNDAFKERGYGFGGSWPVASARGLPSFIPPIIRIDYIWHNDGLRALEASQGPRLGSDHLPVLAVLELLPPSR